MDSRPSPYDPSDAEAGRLVAEVLLRDRTADRACYRRAGRPFGEDAEGFRIWWAFDQQTTTN